MRRRWFAIIDGPENVMRALLVTGYRSGGNLRRRGRLIGYALDYYPNEKPACQAEFGHRIIGDFASRKKAENAVTSFFDFENWYRCKKHKMKKSSSMIPVQDCR